MYRVFFLCALSIATLAAEVGGPDAPLQNGEGEGLEGAAGGGMGMLIWLLPLGLLVILMMSSSRTQKREARQRQEMIDAVKVGDRVITIGGMHGEIVKKGESTVDLRLGENGPCITFNITAIASVQGRDAAVA